MTTIATDGYRVAADSLVVEGHRRVSSFKKLWRHGGYVYGASGNLNDIVRFIEEQKKGNTVEFNSETSPSIIRVRNGKVEFSDNGHTWHKCSVPYAIGSGGAIALGAMANYATPERAVRIAKKYDVNTGGKIVAMYADGR